jgi:AcrR family transcriptional regulator
MAATERHGGVMVDPETDRSAAARPPRERLLDAGLELFGTVGYEGTTVQALCREARVSTRDFYRYAGQRLDLFRDVFAREARHVQTSIVAALAEAPLLWLVRAALWTRSWLGDMLQDRRRYRVLYREAIGVSGELDRLRSDFFRWSSDLMAQQLSLCARFRGNERPDACYEMPAVVIPAAAREILMQYMEGNLDLNGGAALTDALVHLCAVIGEW